MGLTLVYGRAGSGKTHTCFEQIRAQLRHSPQGQALLLLLPEQATFQAEQELARTADLHGFMRAYVLGFRRLAHRVLLETGGAARPRIDELGRRMTLRSLLLDNLDSWKAFRRAARQRGFCGTVADLLTEFKSYCVAPDLLADVENRLPPGELADKLHDLALLYRLFHDFIRDRFTDPEDVLTLLAQKIPYAPLLAGSQVWVDGFHFFTPQEYGVIQQLLTTSAQVTVTLCWPGNSDREGGQETDLFDRQGQTRKRLLELAQEVGVQVEEQHCQAQGRFRAGSLLAHVEQQWAYNGYEPYEQSPCTDVRISEAANRRVEVEAIARDVIRLVREQDYRYRDIAVLLRDLENYAELIERVFADYDIPLFSDRQRPVVHHPLAELIRSALEVKSQNWAYEPVFRCLKTDLLPASRADIDELENYVLEFGIRGTQWVRPEPWAYVRRFGLGDEKAVAQAQQQKLEHIHAVRTQVGRPLQVFCERVGHADNIAAYCLALYELLNDLQVAETLTRWADEQEQQGLLEEALEHRQLWDGMMELLDQLVESCGQQTCSLDDFQNMIGEGLDTLSFRLIPPGLDHVTLGPLERSRPGQVRAVYLPGVQEGVLPLRAHQEGIIDDNDRQVLSTYSVQLAPSVAEDALAEQFLIYTALTRASEYLWVSYSLADEEGEGLLPSPLIRRLRRVCGMQGVEYIALEAPPQAEQDYVVHPQRSLTALAAGLRRFKAQHASDPCWWGWGLYHFMLERPWLRPGLQTLIAGLFHHNVARRLPLEVAHELFLSAVPHERGRRYLQGSVTRLESYRACPFRFFAQYGLNLHERALYRLGTPDVGQFLHAGMQRFGETLRDRHCNWGDLDEPQLVEVCHAVVATLAPQVQNEILLSSRQMQHLLGRLEQRMVKTVQRLAAFDRVSKFKPHAFELAFGDDGGKLGPLVLDLDERTALALRGRIDRIDTACINDQHYLLVLDYKSGEKFFGLSEVLHGIKLQLLTYLLVLREMGDQALHLDHGQSAGVLYCFLKNPRVYSTVPLSPEQVEREINKKLKMPGWLLNDERVLSALDMHSHPQSAFLPLGFTKNGQLSAASLKTVKTANEFDVLLDYVQQTLRQTAQDVLTGVVDIDPCCLGDYCSCTYCTYRPVCQFDATLEENQFRRLHGGKDDEVMNKMRAALDAKREMGR